MSKKYDLHLLEIHKLTERAEKAEAERDRLREALEKIKSHIEMYKVRIDTPYVYGLARDALDGTQLRNSK